MPHRTQLPKKGLEYKSDGLEVQRYTKYAISVDLSTQKASEQHDGNYYNDNTSL